MSQQRSRVLTVLGAIAIVVLTSCSKAPRPAAQSSSAAGPPSPARQAAQVPPAMPGHIRLRVLPALATQVEALPRVVPNENVTPEQAARLNAIFNRYDRNTRTESQDCTKAVRAAHRPSKDGDYEISIAVKMRGPQYLSIVVNGSYDCGGAHPGDSTSSLVYDVTTGTRLNWLAALPGSRTSKSSDGIESDAVIWPPLQKVSQQQAEQAVQKDPDPDDDCRPLYGDKNMPFVVWLDAKQGAIVAYPADFSHFDSATCGEEVVINLALAQRLGVSPLLISQLEAAHTAAQQTAAAKKAAQ